jgi:hypothetical protein
MLLTLKQNFQLPVIQHVFLPHDQKKRVSKKYEIITARFAKVKSQGSQRQKLQMINFANIAKPWRTLR